MVLIYSPDMALKVVAVVSKVAVTVAEGPGDIIIKIEFQKLLDFPINRSDQTHSGNP